MERRVFWGQTEGSRAIALGVVETTSAKRPTRRTLLASSGAGLAAFLEGTVFLLEASTEQIGCGRKGCLKGNNGRLWSLRMKRATAWVAHRSPQDPLKSEREDVIRGWLGQWRENFQVRFLLRRRKSCFGA